MVGLSLLSEPKLKIYMGVYASGKENAEKSFETIRGQVEGYVKSKLN